MTNDNLPFPASEMMSLTDQSVSLDLAESVGPDLLLSELLAPEGDRMVQDLPLAYGTSRGDLTLRELIAENHGVSADSVVVTVGGMHAIFLLSMIVARAGTEVVTLRPSFPSAHQAVGLFGAKVRSISTNFDQSYRPDFDELCSLLTPTTSLVTLASPQNPSGVLITSNLLRAVAQRMDVVCPQAYLLVDETYREAGYGNGPSTASAMDLHPRIVSCASLSKCHGAPGLRIGWAITQDPVLREQLERGKFASVIACSAVDEALATRLLQQSDSVLSIRRKRLGEGVSRVQRWVDQNDSLVGWVRPDAGGLCCLRLDPSRFGHVEVALFHRKLAELGSRVSPGQWFGDDANVFRLGFGLPDAKGLDLGLTLLSEAITEAAR